MTKIKSIIIFLIVIFLPLIGGQTGLIILDFLIIVSIFILGVNKKIFAPIRLLIFPILFAFFIGINRYSSYDVLKDLFYFLYPVLYFLMGTLIAKKIGAKTLLFSIVTIGTCFAIYSIINVFSTAGISALLDPRKVNEEEGGGRFAITVVSFVILIYSSNLFNLKIVNNKIVLKLLLILNFLSIYLSGSRTNILCSILMVIIISYPAYKNKVLSLVKYVSIFMSIFAALIFLNPESHFSTIILGSFDEISIKDAQDETEMNNNYRGYESFVAFHTFKNEPISEQILGAGFGKLVDMGFSSPVGLRYIPITHNGYIYILLKTGIVGVISFLLYGLKIIKLAIKSSCEKSFFRYFLVAGVLAIYIMNYVIVGIFNPGYSIFWIIIGASLQYSVKSYRNE